MFPTDRQSHTAPQWHRAEQLNSQRSTCHERQSLAVPAVCGELCFDPLQTVEVTLHLETMKCIRDGENIHATGRTRELSKHYRVRMRSKQVTKESGSYL